MPKDEEESHLSELFQNLPKKSKNDIKNEELDSKIKLVGISNNDLIQQPNNQDKSGWGDWDIDDIDIDHPEIKQQSLFLPTVKNNFFYAFLIYKKGEYK